MAHFGRRHWPAYLIQERHYEDLKQWRSPRDGWRSAVLKSPWKTIRYGVYDLDEAKRICGELPKVGLVEYRIMFRGKAVWNE